MKTWETAKSGILWIPDRICNCFTLLRSIKQAKKAFPTLPDTYFVHKSHQLAELPSRESKFDQISPTKKPQNYVCQFSNGFVLYRPVSLWFPDIELNV